MKFEDVFRLSEPMSSEPTRQSGVRTGAYESGLFSVVPEGMKSLLSEWHWTLPVIAEPVLVTAFGDVFYEEEGIIHYLNVQRGETEFIDRDERWFFDEFLTNAEIRATLLRTDLFAELCSLHGKPSYLQCFILKPWQFLGGREDAERFEIGSAEVYLNLVGQALSPDAPQES